MRHLARIAAFAILAAFVAGAMPSYGADCGKALFGWTASDGTRIEGTLVNEGVTKKNPRGFQKLKSDPGNFKRGEFCGGTAFGWPCAQLPKRYDVATLTREQATQLYHDNQWAEIRGDEIISQYLAYKIFDLGVNMGTGTAAILVTKTINDLNGKQADFPVKAVITSQVVDWINLFTAPQTLTDGTESNWRRWCFFAQLKANALARYGDLIAKNPKLRTFWANWKDRAEHD